MLCTTVAGDPRRSNRPNPTLRLFGHRRGPRLCGPRPTLAMSTSSIATLYYVLINLLATLGPVVLIFVAHWLYKWANVRL